MGSGDFCIQANINMELSEINLSFKIQMLLTDTQIYIEYKSENVSRETFIKKE